MQWKSNTANTVLIAYDLLILRRGAGKAFSRRRDKLLLALAVPVGLLCVWSAADGIAAKAAEVSLAPKAALIGLAGCIVAQAVAARLDHLRAHTMMARHALKGRTAVIHAGFWSAPPLLAALSILVRGPRPVLASAAAIASYVAGASAAFGLCALRRQLLHSSRLRKCKDARANVPELQEGTRRQKVVRLLIARSGLSRVPVAGNLALFAASGTILGLLVPLRQSAASASALLFAAFASLLLVGLAMRQHAGLVRYLLFLGIMPTGPALVPLIPVAVLVIGFVTAVASLDAVPAPWLIGGGAGFLLFLACVALLRAYHYAAKSRHAAEFAVQIDLGLIAAAVIFATPVAPVLFAARLWTLRRAAAALRYTLQ
ncbi:MAG TPA: hypothetical protein VGB48_04590 [Allosphingosinicella sp.]